LTQVDRSRGLIVGQTVLPSARAAGAPDEEGRRQDRLPPDAICGITPIELMLEVNEFDHVLQNIPCDHFFRRSTLALRQLHADGRPA
jgi:hypothetical protein